MHVLMPYYNVLIVCVTAEGLVSCALHSWSREENQRHRLVAI